MMWLLIGCIHCKEMMSINALPDSSRCPICGKIGIYTADFKEVEDDAREPIRGYLNHSC